MTSDEVKAWVKNESKRIRDLTLSGIDNIPADLRERKAWLVYRVDAKRDEKTGEWKLGKPPVAPQTGNNISPTDPKQWHTFDAAVS